MKPIVHITLGLFLATVVLPASQAKTKVELKDTQGKAIGDIVIWDNCAVQHARKVCEKEDAGFADLTAAIPLLGRDPATRGDDLTRLAGLLDASRAVNTVQGLRDSDIERQRAQGLRAVAGGNWRAAARY